MLALFEGTSWTDVTDGVRPTVITYSFTQTEAAQFGITPLHDEARAAVRAAFAAWDAVSGLAFVEVTDPYPRGVPMIDIGFSQIGDALGVSGYPFNGTAIYFDIDVAGLSWAPGSVMFFTAVHEIGHALGLKHPFEGTYTLDPSRDNMAWTVMSYTSVGAFPTGPAPLDIAVMQALYGTQASEATDGIDWSFNAATQTFTIAGGTPADRIAGTSAADIIDGLGANDTVHGGHGNDLVRGGEGDDQLTGEFGNDTLIGGEGRDLLDGDDLFSFSGSLGDFRYDDDLRGGGGDDTLYGGQGDDLLDGGTGNDRLDGGDGFDIAVVAANRASLSIVQIGTGQYRVTDPTGPFNETFSGIEAIQATDGIVLLGTDDSMLFKRFNPTAGSNEYERGIIYDGPVTYLRKAVFGSQSGEIYGGTALADQINAFGGDDAVNGNAGNDVIDGGTGSNFLSGGTGWDTFFLDGRGGTVTWGTITDWEAGEHLSVWGYRPGTSNITWVENSGAAGFQGVTMHADLDGNGLIDTSATWTGLTYANLPAPVTFDGLLWFR
jgi:serralysin